MLENRPIVVLAIGYIIGIIMGLYCKISIVFLYVSIFIIFSIMKKTKNKINKFKLISVKRYLRYVKIIFTKRVIFIICIVSIISNSVTLYQNYRYENLYSDLNEESVTIIGRVISNAKDKEYKKVYKIKIEQINGDTKYKNTCLYINVSKDLDTELEYGQRIKIQGIFEEPTTRRNYKGFDYKEYLKTLKIYGTIDEMQILEVENTDNFSIFKISNSIFLKIKNLIQTNFDEETSSVLLGIVLGYTEEIDENIKLNFQESNISHILAVSGMHIGYIIIFLKIFLEKLLGKRRQKFITIIILICYMFITGFSASIVRAGIMGILALLADIVYKKSDIWQNMSLALLLLLVYNPFLIESISVWLTFVGTIGILTISVFVFIMPVMAICYNKVAITSIIIGIAIGIFVGPVVVCGFVFIIFYKILEIMNIKIIFIKIISLCIGFIINLAELGSILPLNKIYVTTPNILEVILYYLIIFIVCFLYWVYKSKSPTVFQERVKNLMSLLKYKFNQNKKKILSIILIFTIIFFSIKIIPKNLKIYFIDVGQGDSTLIITPYGKSILIDGGGNEFGTYDVGESTLLPYLLDRGIKKVNYAVISHFDTDHCEGILYVMEEITVENVIISTIGQESDNYNEFVQIVNEKNINVIIVKAGDRINIENNLYFDILWPTADFDISDNEINNASIVCKLSYKNFSMLFTGDIEEIAEEEIVNLYKDTNILNATVLKVAHHGSKTSSSLEFLQCVMPTIALIGVGENNSYGHPADVTLENLQIIGAKVYRTDELGEIIIESNGKKISV